MNSDWAWVGLAVAAAFFVVAYMRGTVWIQRAVQGQDVGFAGIVAFAFFVLGLAATNFSATALALELFEEELELETVWVEDEDVDEDQGVYDDE